MWNIVFIGLVMFMITGIVYSWPWYITSLFGILAFSLYIYLQWETLKAVWNYNYYLGRLHKQENENKKNP